jgi:hypothetical protein
MHPVVAQAKTTEIVFNQSQETGGWRVPLADGTSLEGTVAPHRGGLCFLGEDDRILAVGACGKVEHVIEPNPLTLLETTGDLLAFSLDGGDLRRSKQLILLPLQPGTISWQTQAQWGNAAAHVGEVVDGRWQGYETLPLKAVNGRLSFEVDQDRNKTIIIVCERADLNGAAGRLARTMTHPQQRPW